MNLSKLSWQTWLSALLPPVLWAMVIFTLSAQQVLPGFEIDVYDFVFKKLGHVAVYAVLYWLIWRALAILRPTPTAWQWSLPLLICLLYGIFDEYHQSFTPGRYPSPRDVGYDLLGASLAFLKKYGYI